MKAAFLDYASLGPGDVDPAPLRRLVPGIELYPDTGPAEIGPRLAGVEVLVINKIALSAALIERAPALKLVCLAATGTDNVALGAARRRGIAVTNIRDYCAPSVTQHVFALLLALNQRLGEYRALLAGGAWERSANFCLLDFPFGELAGRTLGIVGLGNLGRSVARAARAFGMQVLAARRPYAAAGAGPAEPAGDGVQRVDFAEVLARSHVLTLHCPLTPETRQLVNAPALSRMRRDAILINTARGGLVDAAALVEALAAGTIAGAGIDVLEHEPPAPGHPLLQARLTNLIVTPHIAWAARESRQRAIDEIALNIAAFLQGERRNRVD